MYYNGDKMDITIREIDDELYRQAKARAALMETTIGRVVNLALEKWLEEEEKGKGRKSFLELLKPVRFGKGTERSSERIDEVVYGGTP
jgi:hypothetical protein